MTKMSRYIQHGDWIFEIKSVRALKVGKYGDPYSAIASLTLNGDTAYYDGLMTRDDTSFDRKDFKTLIEFCRQLDVKAVNFDRFKNNKLVTETVNLESPLEPTPAIPLKSVI